RRAPLRGSALRGAAQPLGTRNSELVLTALDDVVDVQDRWLRGDLHLVQDGHELRGEGVELGLTFVDVDHLQAAPVAIADVVHLPVGYSKAHVGQAADDLVVLGRGRPFYFEERNDRHAFPPFESSANSGG